MAQDPKIYDHAISRVPATDQTTELVPVSINSSNKWAASTAGSYSDGTLQDTGESPSELTALVGGISAGARFVRASGTCTAGADAKATATGYQDAANGDVVVGRFLTTTSTVGDSALMLPYERAQYPKGSTKLAYFSLTGAAIHAGAGGVVAWQNPEGARIIVTRTILDLTTVSAGACTLDVGVTAVSATTTSDTLLDGVDANAAIAVFDSQDPAIDSGANAHAQSLASGGWITVDEKSGDATGLVGTLRIEYYLAA